MTIQGALTDLTILLNADDIPCYYKTSIKKVIETIEQEPKTVQEKQADSEKYQKAFDDGYDNGYAQARFDYEQEPCEDAVSRKRLLDNYNGVETSVGYRKVVDFEVIKNMPPVTPTQKWIPCSEKPPKEDGRYLAYIVNEHDTKLRYTMTCVYIARINSWFPDDQSASDNVVAWQPLPDAYEGSEINDERK